MLFLVLLPFASFALLMLLVSAKVSLFSAAAIAAGVLALDLMRGRSAKSLTIGAVVVFAGVGCYVAIVDADFSRNAIRFAVDAGMLAVVLMTLAIRAPFTMQYARELVDAQTARLPGFVTVNYILTWAWSAAFVLMLLADMLMIYAPSLPIWIGLAVAFAARNGAAYFTKWYPAYRRARLAAQSQLP